MNAIHTMNASHRIEATGKRTSSAAPAARLRLAARWAALAAVALPGTPAHAGYAQPGQGLQVVTSGTVANGALYWHTEPTWVNLSTPDKPYQIETRYALPPCLGIAVARLALTVWGGTANHVCHLRVSVNGAPLPGADPLAFGGTADANPVFEAASACAYGSGSGVWLVTLPVAGHLLRNDGGANRVAVTIDTPDNFDGRVQHVTLLAVYRSALLANSFDYSLAEGSGDLYRTPGAGQSDRRTVAFGAVAPDGVTGARLTTLATYGDTGQNDRLLFNGTALGGDDVAGWDKAGSGRDFGPSVAGFDVTAHLAADNVL
jgi:hypothetical protein